MWQARLLLLQDTSWACDGPAAKQSLRLWRPRRPAPFDPAKAHDWFNMAAIGALNALNLHFLATGEGFSLFWSATMLYFLFDMVFVGLYPQSVRSPVVILGHHTCTALYMMVPHFYPAYHWCMGYCMLVEINTWLLIARRTIGGPLVDAAFYATWVGLRCVWYPWLIYVFAIEFERESKLAGTYLNPTIIAMICQVLLTALNYHWTLQLAYKILRKRKAAADKRRAAAPKCT